MSSLFRSLLLTSLVGVQAFASAQADAGIAVHGVVAATAGAAIVGSLYGNNLTDVARSGISKQQIGLLAGSDADGDMHSARLTYRIEPKKTFWKTKDFALSANLELSVGQWQADRKYKDRSLTDFGLTPIFKMKSHEKSPWYAEVGVGVHLLSQVDIKDYSKSTQFQFGDQFGLGWENQQLRVGYKYLHVSNANIEKPNPSTDFHFVELGYRF
ncbi:MAG: acyloxyacyl hydrolase [Gammaproteobacteria bacterium]|nr:acyloxyacyl hydrolase [Gammaproteobacteria bacterium]